MKQSAMFGYMIESILTYTRRPVKPTGVLTASRRHEYIKQLQTLISWRMRLLHKVSHQAPLRWNLWDYLRASISCWGNRKLARQEERSPRSISHSQLTIPTFQHQRGRAAVENNRNKCEYGCTEAVMTQKRCIQIKNRIIDDIKG